MPEAMSSIVATFLLDGVEYLGVAETGVDKQWQDIRVSEADPYWSFTDDKGHFHAFDTYSKQLPTLNERTVHMPCNGGCGSDSGCDGYQAPRWFCRICGQPVKPEFKIVEQSQLVAATHWWKATVRGPFMMPGTKVSVRVRSSEQAERFGVAVVVGVDYDSADEGAELRLEGDGRLGFRPILAPS